MSPKKKRNWPQPRALEYVKPGTIVGVGTGSTVNHFIDLLAEKMGKDIKAAVSSSEASTQRMQQHGIAVKDLNEVGSDVDLWSMAPMNPTINCT